MGGGGGITKISLAVALGQNYDCSLYCNTLVTFLSTSKNDWRITLCILLIDLILLYRPLYACIELFSPSSCAACPSVPAFGVDFQYFSFFAIFMFS